VTVLPSSSHVSQPHIVQTIHPSDNTPNDAPFYTVSASRFSPPWASRHIATSLHAASPSSATLALALLPLPFPPHDLPTRDSMTDTSSIDAALLLLLATLSSLRVSAHIVRSMQLRRAGQTRVAREDTRLGVRYASDLRPRRRAAHADGLGSDIRSHAHHTRAPTPSLPRLRALRAALLALRPRLSTAQISAVTCAVRRRVQALRASAVAHVVREIQCDAPYTSAQLAGIAVVLRDVFAPPLLVLSPFESTVADDATAALVSLSSPRTLSMSSLESRLSGTTLVQEESSSEEGGLVWRHRRLTRFYVGE
jgi:hypothetical protein